MLPENYGAVPVHEDTVFKVPLDGSRQDGAFDFATDAHQLIS